MLDDDDDTYDDNVALRGDQPLYRASTPFSDVIRDKESKESCKNRLREYFIETYNESFINVYLTGRQAVRKLIVILGAESARNAICIDPHDKLKRNEKAMTSIFTHMTCKRLESPKKNALSQSQISHFSLQKRMLSLPSKNLVPWIPTNLGPLEEQISKKSNSPLLI